MISCLYCKKSIDVERSPCYAIKYQKKAEQSATVSGILGYVCINCGVDLVMLYKYYIDITEEF